MEHPTKRPIIFPFWRTLSETDIAGVYHIYFCLQSDWTDEDRKGFLVGSHDSVSPRIRVVDCEWTNVSIEEDTANKMGYWFTRVPIPPAQVTEFRVYKHKVYDK